MAKPSHPFRVVLCDDAAPYRTVMGLHLSLDEDFELVGEATNGHEAIERVAELAPDLLLLDVSMPVMSGIEALPQIRETSPDTVVFMVTGMTADRIRTQSEQLGAAAFLDKAEGLAAVRGALAQLGWLPAA